MFLLRARPRPRVDHLGDPVGGDAIAGAERNGLAAVEIDVGAAAEQAPSISDDRRPSAYATLSS